LEFEGTPKAIVCLSEMNQMVVFRLGQQRYALMLNAVERIVRAVEVMPLPKAPAIVLGVINVEGRILPVLNVRERFGLPDKEITPTNQFLIARTERRPVVLVIDEAEGIVERSSAEIIGPSRIVPGLEQIRGVIKLEDGLALICDLEKFLTLDEADVLEEAMNKEAARAN
jgi:purine-binding chemotaxis protein CheW